MSQTISVMMNFWSQSIKNGSSLLIAPSDDQILGIEFFNGTISKLAPFSYKSVDFKFKQLSKVW